MNVVLRTSEGVDDEAYAEVVYALHKHTEQFLSARAEVAQLREHMTAGNDYRYQTMHRRAQAAESLTKKHERQLAAWQVGIRRAFGVLGTSQDRNNRYDTSWAEAKIRWVRDQLTFWRLPWYKRMNLRYALRWRMSMLVRGRFYLAFAGLMTPMPVRVDRLSPEFYHDAFRKIANELGSKATLANILRHIRFLKDQAKRRGI